MNNTSLSHRTVYMMKVMSQVKNRLKMLVKPTLNNQSLNCFYVVLSPFFMRINSLPVYVVYISHMLDKRKKASSWIDFGLAIFH